MWLAGRLLVGSTTFRFARFLHLKRKEVYMVSPNLAISLGSHGHYAISYLLSLGMLPHPGRARVGRPEYRAPRLLGSGQAGASRFGYRGCQCRALPAGGPGLSGAAGEVRQGKAQHPGGRGGGHGVRHKAHGAAASTISIQRRHRHGQSLPAPETVPAGTRHEGSGARPGA